MKFWNIFRKCTQVKPASAKYTGIKDQMYRVTHQYWNTLGPKKPPVRIEVETKSRSVLESTRY